MERVARRMLIAGTAAGTAAGTGIALVGGAQAATPRALPLIGAYLGPDCRGLERLAAYEAWLGRPTDVTIDFLDRRDWERLHSSLRWQLHCRARQGRRLVVSLPLVPDGVTLAAGADGSHAAQHARVGEALVARGFADAIIRIGWEFNGNWYPWAAAADPAAFIACWRAAALALRRVRGARFLLDWTANPGPGPIRAERAWPGDDVVDVIGLDAYNQTWPALADPEERWRRLMTQPDGLAWHRDVAAAKNRPRSFPEWGTGTQRDGAGGGDDPLYVARMLAWMREGPPVLYAGYWEFADHIFDARLMTGHRPAASDAYRAGLR